MEAKLKAKMKAYFPPFITTNKSNCITFKKVSTTSMTEKKQSLSMVS